MLYTLLCYKFLETKRHPTKKEMERIPQDKNQATNQTQPQFADQPENPPLHATANRE